VRTSARQHLYEGYLDYLRDQHGTPLDAHWVLDEQPSSTTAIDTVGGYDGTHQGGVTPGYGGLVRGLETSTTFDGSLPCVSRKYRRPAASAARSLVATTLSVAVPLNLRSDTFAAIAVSSLVASVIAVVASPTDPLTLIRSTPVYISVALRATWKGLIVAMCDTTVLATVVRR